MNTFYKILKEYEEIIIIIGLFLVCFLVFFNSFNNDFLIDDLPMLKNNYLMGSAKFFQIDLSDLKLNAYFRPATHYLNFVTFMLFGQKPLGYHLVNLFFFYLAALTIYLLFRMILGNSFIALLSSLFFCVHPINGILVNYKNATGFPFMIFAMNMSLINFMQANYYDGGRHKIIFSIIWFIIALLCHELIIMYPFYLASILLFLKKEKFNSIFHKLIPCISIVLIYLLFRHEVSSLKILENYNFFNFSILQYFTGVSKLFFWYFKNLIFPFSVVLMYTAKLTDPNNINIIFTFFLMFFASIYIMFNYKKHANLSFFVSWIMIGLITIFIGCFSRPSFGFIIEPHWLIFPSIAFFGILSLLFYKLNQKIKSRVWILIIASVLSILTLISKNYNFLWSRPRYYCEFWNGVDKNSYLGKFWLGYSYIEEKEYAKAKSIFQKLKGYNLRKGEVNFNLGLIEYNLKNFSQAENYFKYLVKIEPKNPDGYYYLGNIKFDNKEYEIAEKFYLKAINLNRFFIPPKEKLAEVYILLNKKEKSLELYKEILYLNPNNIKAVNFLKR